MTITLSNGSILSSMTEGFIQREIETLDRLYREADYHKQSLDRTYQRIRSCGAAIERYQKTLEALK